MGRIKQMIYNMILKKYDPISRLYTRNYFYHITDKVLKKYYNKKFVIINMDVFNFKLINEFYSNSEGDILLKKIGDGIRRFFKNDIRATYYRDQADVFFVCFKYEEKRIKEYVEYMESLLNEGKYDLPLNLYFGVYIINDYREKECNVFKMCESARIALKTIKGNYYDSIAFFDDSMRKEFNKKVSIINDMNKALNQKEFELYLQPKYNIVTNYCVGAEALVRWNHPERGIIPPDEFIPIFEENGFIIKLDEYMIEMCCMKIKQWIDDGKDAIPISVNISQANLKNEYLYDILTGCIEKYQIPKNLLELEITETAYVKNNQILKDIINKLQKYGFKIHMDDFGSGYSSLSLLSELPVDTIKMDLKFLNSLTETNKGKNIISMVIKMAKSLGIDIITEGIENISHVTFLQNVGCVVGQGYHFSKPMKSEEFEKRFLTDMNERILNYSIDRDVISKKIGQSNSPWNMNELGKESEVLFEALAKCNICVWEYDIVHKRIIQTGASMRVHGCNKIIENVPNTLIESGHVHKDSAVAFRNMYKLLQNGAKEASCIIKVKRPDGSYWWEKINYITSFDENGRAVRALGISNDVTNMMANKMDKNQELLKIAYKDELTDIGNRRACFNYINELIHNKCSFSVAYIDIDSLKYVNDKFGHNKGDEYIKYVVDMIKTSIRGDEELFRIGGDEFIYIDKNNDTNFINDKFLLLDSKIKSLNRAYKAAISYGVVYVDSNSNLTCKEILSKADKKMYIYKQRKKIDVVNSI